MTTNPSDEQQAPERVWEFDGFIKRQPNGCWLWIGTLTKNGYGQLPKHRDRYAHRSSFRFFHGPIPPRMSVLHKRHCTSKACVNPDHLYVGTQKENVADAIAVGQMPYGERNGHAKHSAETVRRVRSLFASGMRQVEIRKQLGLHKSVVWEIVHERRRKHA